MACLEHLRAGIERSKVDQPRHWCDETEPKPCGRGMEDQAAHNQPCTQNKKPPRNTGGHFW